MVRRAACLLLVLLLLLPGCWDQREVEMLALVDGMALERGSAGQVKLTLQIVNARAMSRTVGGRPPGIKNCQNFSAEGPTVEYDLAKINALMGYRPFFTSLRVVVIGEDLARERDLREVLDFLIRNREIRRTAWFAVARSPINRLFDVNTPMEVTPSAGIEHIMETNDLSGFYAVTHLADVVRAAAAPGMSPTAAEVAVRPAAFEAPPDMEARHLMLPEPREDLVLDGAAVFRNYRLVGWLDDRQANGLLWVQGKRGGVIEVPAGGAGTSLTIVRARSKVRMRKVGGQPAIFVRIEADTRVGETMTSLDLTKPAVYSDLEEKAAVVVQKEVEAALSKALAGYKADIFGFSQVVHRADPRLWQRLKGDWSDRLPQLPVSVEAVVHVSHSGLVSRPLLKLH